MFLLTPAILHAQQVGTIKGIVIDDKGEKIPGAVVYLENTGFSQSSAVNGAFKLEQIPFGNYQLNVFLPGKQVTRKAIELNTPELHLDISLKALSNEMDVVIIQFDKQKDFGLTRMAAVENFGIYEGKKTEVIELQNVSANLATNNPRQVYAKITGLNIWESDGAGLQLGIGGRGLSPNRTANFNVRQNGYDISADALGYPESYYTPPVEALERIELVRGAASLQYGTQFGGMLNFRFKRGTDEKTADVVSRQTVGSWGFFNSFNSLGGTSKNKKLNHYSYAQYKRGEGFRPNSGFNAVNLFTSIDYQLSKKFKVGLELTKMSYLAQQPGGLTDKNFEQDPRMSLRERNWFEVDWNMAALHLTYEFNEKTQINSRSFGLLAHRNALGNLERINVADLGGERTMIGGEFRNIGNETRLLHRYSFLGESNTLLIGSRLYSGFTSARQGNANDSSGPDFFFLNPDNLENSEYDFHNFNASLFAEHIFNFGSRFSVTPGARFEHIATSAEGYYKIRVKDAAGNLIAESKREEQLGRTRNFVIFGLGTNYRITEQTSIYGNITQNYRAINFSDIRIVNPNFRVDENIQDETGYTADLGIRSKKENVYNIEFTAFLVRYNDKIGQVLRADQAPLFLDYRFRGNISDARNIGLEFFGEFNFPTLWQNEKKQNFDWVWFINAAVVDARYINTDDSSIRNKIVEMVPPLMLRSGTQLNYKKWRAGFQIGHTARHYTDATNAERTATAVEGIVPSYQVADLSLAYKFGRFCVEGSVNNLFNQMYFTRRAEGYPGPGIIPADGRGFYFTLAGRF
ncbi:MAG: TonB-dependent receptor domain-containing protein [Flavobacteriales bacterium]